MVISSLFIQASPELLTTQRDLNSSWLTFSLGCVENKKLFIFGSICFSIWAYTDHTLFITSCVQTNRFGSLLLGCSIRNHVIRDVCFIHCFYTWMMLLYLIESLRASKIYRIILRINLPECWCAIVLRCSKKIVTMHGIVYPPIAHHKKIFLTFITFTFVKIFCLGLDEFPQDTQFIGFPVINSYSTNLFSFHILTAYLSIFSASFM